MPKMPSMPKMPKMPNMPSMPSMPSWSSDSATPRDGSGNNIELEINETNYNTELKRVSVDIFIPRNAQVIVKDYAKNTANETLAGISTIGV